MLIIYCGEDVVASRDKFIDYRKQKEDQGFEAHSVSTSNLSDDLSRLVGSIGLFADKKIICGEELLHDKKSRDLLKDYQEIDTEIILYETSLGERELKFVFPKARFINSKLGSSVFTFLDSLTPGNLKSTMSQLSQNVTSDNQLLLFYLTKSRIRELILVKENMIGASKLQAWQIGKLKSQATNWKTDKLYSIYNNIFKIEKNVKTSGSAFSIKQSLEMLFCFYL